MMTRLEVGRTSVYLKSLIVGDPMSTNIFVAEGGWKISVDDKYIRLRRRIWQRKRIPLIDISEIKFNEVYLSIRNKFEIALTTSKRSHAVLFACIEDALDFKRLLSAKTGLFVCDDPRKVKLFF